MREMPILQKELFKRLGRELAEKIKSKRKEVYPTKEEIERELCERDSNFDHAYLMKFEEWK